MAEVQRLKVLLAKMKSRASQAAEERPVVAVGYSQAYAIWVHENLEAHHPVGQAKFLEQPARELSGSGEITRIVAAGQRQGKTLAQSLLAAGLRLQRESQLRCPVDTGALRASAFTRLEGSGQDGSGGESE